MPVADEHVPSRYLGSRLKTRRVCKGCNERAGREIDDRMANYLMVQVPKALADVRSIKHQEKEPHAESEGVVSATGEQVRLTFDPRGMQARRATGEPVREPVELRYGLDSDLWVWFTAKLALGCAAKLLPEEWPAQPLARAIRDLLWHRPPIDHRFWPDGVPGWPGELDCEHPARQALGDRLHLVGFTAPADRDDSTAAVGVLFGGQIVCELPLPGVRCPGSGRIWVIDSRASSPPTKEDYDAAIERLLRAEVGQSRRSTRCGSRSGPACWS
jgi:hypothetical protein